MFGSLGIPELLLIFVVILIVFGPRRLPEIGKTLGKALGEFRKATDDLKSTIEREVRLEELKAMAPSMITPVQSVARVDSFAPLQPVPAVENIPVPAVENIPAPAIEVISAPSVSRPEPLAEAAPLPEAAPSSTVDPDRKSTEPAE